jgi:hypothetical protein
MLSLRNRLIAFALLCLYGWCGTSISSLVFTKLADWSGDHEVQVQWESAGMRVVLHHRSEMAVTLLAQDHQKPLARALSCLCAIDGHGDHIFAQATVACEFRSGLEPQKHGAKDADDTQLPIVWRHYGEWSFHAFSIAIPALEFWEAQRSARPTMGLGAVALLI